MGGRLLRRIVLRGPRVSCLKLSFGTGPTLHKGAQPRGEFSLMSNDWAVYEQRSA